MRENRLHGSEGGVAKAIPTPIMDAMLRIDALPDKADTAKSRRVYRRYCTNTLFVAIRS